LIYSGPSIVQSRWTLVCSDNQKSLDNQSPPLGQNEYLRIPRVKAIPSETASIGRVSISYRTQGSKCWHDHAKIILLKASGFQGGGPHSLHRTQQQLYQVSTLYIPVANV